MATGDIYAWINSDDTYLLRLSGHSKVFPALPRVQLADRGSAYIDGQVAS